MTHETPPDDPRAMWQSQGREHPIMSVQEILIADLVREKTRRNLMVAFAFGVVLLILCAIAFADFHNPWVRSVVAAIMVLTLIVGYRSYYRILPPYMLSPNAAFKGCLDFYRKELLAQYRAVALTWRLLAPVVVLGFLTFRGFARVNPLVLRVVAMSLLALILVLRRGVARRFKHRLAALDEFEKEDSA